MLCQEGLMGTLTIRNIGNGVIETLKAQAHIGL